MKHKSDILLHLHSLLSQYKINVLIMEGLENIGNFKEENKELKISRFRDNQYHYFGIFPATHLLLMPHTCRSFHCVVL